VHLVVVVDSVCGNVAAASFTRGHPAPPIGR
jgi:hypothetical protein